MLSKTKHEHKNLKTSWMLLFFHLFSHIYWNPTVSVHRDTKTNGITLLTLCLLSLQCDSELNTPIYMNMSIGVSKEDVIDIKVKYDIKESLKLVRALHTIYLIEGPLWDWKRGTFQRQEWGYKGCRGKKENENEFQKWQVFKISGELNLYVIVTWLDCVPHIISLVCQGFGSYLNRQSGNSYTYPNRKII